MILRSVEAKELGAILICGRLLINEKLRAGLLKKNMLCRSMSIILLEHIQLENRGVEPEKWNTPIEKA
jgi:hypothetical protein